jgi:pimeloyl-ACP methyl ester carboxylesterase
MAIDEGCSSTSTAWSNGSLSAAATAATPVLLLLHGGPGFPMSFMAPAFASWERDFTLVQWDQPGAARPI